MADPSVSTACSLLALCVSLLLLYPVAKLSAMPRFMGVFNRQRRLGTSLVGAVAVNTTVTVLLAWMQLEIARLVHATAPGWMDSENSGFIITAIILLSPYSNGSIKPPTADIEIELDKMKLMEVTKYQVAHNRSDIIMYMENGNIPQQLDTRLLDILIAAKQMNEWGDVFSEHFLWAMYLPCATALTVMAFDPTESTLRIIGIITFISTFIACGLTANRFSVGAKIWASAQNVVREKIRQNMQITPL